MKETQPPKRFTRFPKYHFVYSHTGKQQDLMQCLQGRSLLSWGPFIVHLKRPNYCRLLQTKGTLRYLLYLAVQIPAYRSRLSEDSRNDQKRSQDSPERFSDTYPPHMFFIFYNTAQTYFFTIDFTHSVRLVVLNSIVGIREQE